MKFVDDSAAVAEIDAAATRVGGVASESPEEVGRVPLASIVDQFSRAGRRRGGRTIGRRGVNRVGDEVLLQRARYLPETERALITARLGMGMRIWDLALLHRTTADKLSRRIDQISNTLSDPCFLLTVRFGAELPAQLGELARGYWIDGRPLRELATAFGQTLHCVRCEVRLARSLLLIAMASRQKIPAALVQAALASGHVPHRGRQI